MDLSSIHQTEIWAKFRREAKNERDIEIIVEREGKLMAKGYIHKIRLPFGKSWLICHRGPVIYDFSTGVLLEFLEKVKEIAYREKAVYLRIEPPFEKKTETGERYKKRAEELGFRIAHASHQPEATLLLDIDKSEEQILAQMKQKGRYNIRLAEKKGVKIRVSKPISGPTSDSADKERFESDLDAFYKILNETTGRDKFTGHDKEFYKKMLKILGEKDMAKLYLAEFEGKIIAGMIVTYYKTTATYYYGASSNEYRNVMAPYLLHWQAIQDAKKDGFTVYDFFGIAPPGAENHPWEGVTHFKLKFGGHVVQYVKAQEYVFKPFWYWLMLMMKKFR